MLLQTPCSDNPLVLRSLDSGKLACATVSVTVCVFEEPEAEKIECPQRANVTRVTTTTRDLREIQNSRF